MKYLYILCAAVLAVACQQVSKENVYYIRGKAQDTTYGITVKKEWRKTCGGKIIFNLPTTVECATPNVYA